MHARWRAFPATPSVDGAVAVARSRSRPGGVDLTATCGCPNVIGMAARAFQVKLALALLVSTAIAAAAQDPRQIRSPVQSQPTPPQTDVDARRLGRPYPAPIPARPRREAPGVHVSIVSPRDAGDRQRQDGGRSTM